MRAIIAFSIDYQDATLAAGLPRELALVVEPGQDSRTTLARVQAAIQAATGAAVACCCYRTA